MKPQDKCLDLCVELINEFHNIENKHPSDLGDVIFHIHAIQNILYAHKYKVEVPDSGMYGAPEIELKPKKIAGLYPGTSYNK